jgi:hypothetical protein
MRFNTALLFVWFLVGLSVTVGGCSVIDAICGTDAQGTPPTGGSPIGVVGTVLGAWLPGAAAIGTGIAGAWAAFRAKRYKDAFLESAQVIEAIDNKAVKSSLSEAFNKAGLKPLVDKTLAAIGAGPLAPKKNGAS